ncbi:hypothetical protein ACOSQ4_031104 [Xanthoceras sorbifolium]
MPLKYKCLPEFCFRCGLIGHPLREFMDTDQDDIMTGSMALRFGGWLWAESPPRVNTRPSANDSTRAAKQWPGGNNECVSEAGRGLLIAHELYPVRGRRPQVMRNRLFRQSKVVLVLNRGLAIWLWPV